jgi:hypothetical protein
MFISSTKKSFPNAATFRPWFSLAGDCKLYDSGEMTSGHSSLGKVRKLQYTIASNALQNGALIMSPMKFSPLRLIRSN